MGLIDRMNRKEKMKEKMQKNRLLRKPLLIV